MLGKKNSPHDILNLLHLIRGDANRLFQKIEARRQDYLYVFAMNRERNHYPLVFKNRYEETKLELLSQVPSELIAVVDDFYDAADDLKWYLMFTDDSSSEVEEHLLYKIPKIRNKLENLNTYIDETLSESL